MEIVTEPTVNVFSTSAIEVRYAIVPRTDATTRRTAQAMVNKALFLVFMLKTSFKNLYREPCGIALIVIHEAVQTCLAFSAPFHPLIQTADQAGTPAEVKSLRQQSRCMYPEDSGYNWLYTPAPEW